MARDVFLVGFVGMCWLMHPLTLCPHGDLEQMLEDWSGECQAYP